MKGKKFLVPIILVLLLDVLVAAFWFYFISFIKNQTQVIKDLKLQIKTITENRKTERSLESFLKNISSEKERLDSSFLNEEKMVGFIEEVESLRQKTGVELEIGSIDLNSSLLAPKIRIRLKGNFNQIYKTILLLKNMPYMLSFENISLAANRDGKDWTMEAVLSINNFLPYEKN